MINTTGMVELRLAEYIAALNAAAPQRYSFDTTQGKKYTKIIMSYNGGQRSVHAFVDADGNVYKPAGWQRPAVHVRFRLADDASFARLLAAASGKQSFSGGYLYL